MSFSGRCGELNNVNGDSVLGSIRRVSPAYAGFASWQVSGGIAGGSFIPPWGGDADGRRIRVQSGAGCFIFAGFAQNKIHKKDKSVYSVADAANGSFFA
jgi:hypothetical protein